MLIIAWGAIVSTNNSISFGIRTLSMMIGFFFHFYRLNNDCVVIVTFSNLFVTFVSVFIKCVSVCLFLHIHTLS